MRGRLVLALAILVVGLGACVVRSTKYDDLQTEEGLEAAPCQRDGDCPATGQPCMGVTCIDLHCHIKPTPKGAPAGKQQKGDCAKLVCDGRGNPGVVKDPADLPADDGNECTTEVCNGESADHEAVAVGAACGEGGVCNGAGLCGVCLPGKRVCANGAPDVCGTNGQWSHGSRCGGGAPFCEDGGCLSLSALSVGDAQGCAVDGKGKVRCWGVAFGATPAAQPVDGVAGVRSLGVGDDHACALDGDGTVTCWGDDTFGQLGDPKRAGAGAAPVPGVKAVTELAVGGRHTCALLSDATVKCWGADDHGQLGDGAATKPGVPTAAATPEPRHMEQEIVDSGPAVDVVLGGSMACSRTPSGGVRCWRWSQAPGGERSKAGKAAPVAVRGLKDVESIAAGGDHTCAVLKDKDRTVKCWGANASGQLGDGATKDQAAPVAIKGLKGVKKLVGGAAHTCALLDGGALVCWGAGLSGQLGNGTPIDQKAPGPVPVSGVRAVFARGDHTCAFAGGGFTCWGANKAGELGAGPPLRPFPAPIQF